MKLLEIAKALAVACPKGSEDVIINKITSPATADSCAITFISKPQYAEEAAKCPAAVVMVKPGTVVTGKICLEVPDPYLAFAKVGQLFEDKRAQHGTGIHPAAIIDSTAKIAATASVGPLCVIGADTVIGENTVLDAGCIIENGVRIGDSCRIFSRATIRWNCTIGNRTIIQSGAIIGSDGFGNAHDGKAFVRIPSFSNVEIGDDVEIGANSTIDRGTLEPTSIGNGVKIDNLVHLAHNVQVGDHTAIAAQAGVSGSTKIGKHVIIAGQAGFVGHIEIGDKAFIGAKAGVSKDVAPGAKITGYPARDFMTMRRIEAAQSELPALLKDIKKLKKENNMNQ